MDSILRLAEVLKKDSITITEKNQSIALVEAMFGNQSRIYLDKIRQDIRSKMIVRPVMPAAKRVEEKKDSKPRSRKRIKDTKKKGTKDDSKRIKVREN